jgi:hypothetical protein
MLIIQVVLIIAMLVGGAYLLVASPVNSRHLALRRLGLLAFVVFGTAAIIAPGLTSEMAEVVGVGRGTDLLLYLLFVAFLAFVATAGRRQRQLERQLTVLTRRLALDEARPPQAQTDGSARR